MTLSREEEKELLNRIEKGEQKAWEDFVEIYGRLIYYAIQRTLDLKSVKLPQDSIQEIFHSLFVHLAEDSARRLLSYTGKRNCSLATFVRMIAVNYTIDIIRRGARQYYYVDFEEVKEDDFERSFYDEGKTPESFALEREREDRLKRALEGLTREDRAFLRLYLSGMSPRDISRIYKVSVKEVYQRYAFIKDKLKGQILEK